MSNTKVRFLRGSTLRTTNLILNLLAGFFMMPFLIHSLGDRLYGIWLIAGSILGYYGLMDFGLNSAIQHYVSAAMAEKDEESANRIVNTLVRIFSIIGLFLCIASFVAAFLLSLFVKSHENVVVLRPLIIILGLSFGIGFPFRTFSGFLMADMRFDIVSAVDSAKLLLRTAMVVLFVFKGYGLVALAIITASCDLSAYLAQLLIVRSKYKFLRISKNILEKLKVRELFRYSIQSFAVRVTDQLKFNIDNFVIAAILGVNMVTVYAIAARLINYFMEFMDSVMGITVPIFSQFNAAGDHDSIKKYFFFLTKISCFISMCVGFFLINFGNPIIKFWVGEKYTDAYNLLVILIIPSIFDVMQGPGVGLLYGISKQKYYGAINGVDALANLLLSIILGLQYGLYGIALGTAIPMIIIKVLVQPALFCRILNIRLLDFLRESVGKPLISSLLLFNLYGFLVRGYNYPVLSFQFFIQVAVYFALCFIVFLFSLSRVERNFLHQGLRRIKS